MSNREPTVRSRELGDELRQVNAAGGFARIIRIGGIWHP